MIKSEMQKHGIQIGVKEVFEVEVCEFENKEFSYLDTEEILFIGVDEEEARTCYENASDYVKKLNTIRGGLKNGEKFLGLLKEDNILAGIKLDNQRILVSVSELNTIEEIETYIKSAKKLALNRI